MARPLKKRTFAASLILDSEYRILPTPAMCQATGLAVEKVQIIANLAVAKNKGHKIKY